MTVKEALGLLSYGETWQLIGARTGKKLADKYNTEKKIEKYLECECSDSPFFISYRAEKSRLHYGYDRVQPVISIWVRWE